MISFDYIEENYIKEIEWIAKKLQSHPDDSVTAMSTRLWCLVFKAREEHFATMVSEAEEA